MKRRTLHAAVALADEAERRIRAAGRVPPPRADVLAALIPAAQATVRAAKAHRRAARWHAIAAEQAETAAGHAASVVSAIVDQWLASSPPTERRIVELDPAAFRVELVRQDVAAPAREGTC